MTTRYVLYTTILMSLASRLAFADAKGDLAGNLETYAGYANNPVWGQSDLKAADEDLSPDKCRDYIAHARKLGVADTDTIKDSSFKSNPKATADGTITVGDAGWICDHYAAVWSFQKLRAAVQAGLDTAKWMQEVSTDEAGHVEGMSEKPKACLDALDKMKLGDADPITLNDRSTITAKEARATCQLALEDAQKFESTVTGREKAEQQAIVDAYKKAGIKGKRLELFASYGMPDNAGFLAAGCDTFVTDVKKLKKAKKLFVWLEGDDGYTVKKYVFKGDNYSETDRTFDLKDSAYRWCK